MTSSSARVPRHVTAHVFSRMKNATFSRFARCGFLVAIFLLNACGAAGDVEPDISFKPVLVPVKFVATRSGFAIVGDRTIITPIGLLSIGAKIRLPVKDGNSIRVVIRDRNRGGVGLDDIYDVSAGEGRFEAVTNGRTVIQITGEREVIIDITDARIESIEFRRIPLVPDEH